MKEIGKGLLTAARLGVIGFCSYKVIEAANERRKERKERKAEREELMITDEVNSKVDKKEVVKVAVTGAVVALTVVQFDTVKKMQKDVETMKNIINDLQ